MRATNPEQALKEGKKVAKLLGTVYTQNSEPDFNAITQLANYFAIDILGYRDAEIANGFTRGFVAQAIGSPEEATEEYVAGNISVDQLAKAIAKANNLQAQAAKNEERLKLLEAQAESQRGESPPPAGTVDGD